MNYGLRLVIPEQEIADIENFPRQSARQILALVNNSCFMFSDCLDLCRAQSKITPGFNYWEFAESNQEAFASLFDVLKPDSRLENGLALINTFIMLVYLRLATKRAATTRTIFFRALFRDNPNGKNANLLWWVDHFAKRLTEPDTPTLPCAKKQVSSEQAIGIEGFKERIGKVLEK